MIRLERLRAVERHLLPLVLLTALAGLLVPAAGTALQAAVTPMLALMLLCTGLTFDLGALRAVLARPGVALLATVLVYGPMSLAGLALGRLLLGDGPLGLGMILVGTLPTDVSSPLLVWMARGNVALATVLNAINTSLSPVLVPVLFLALTGVSLDVPVAGLVLELAAVVVVPTAAGVTLRTRFPAAASRSEPLLSAVASLAYLGLLLAVVGPNAGVVLAAPLVALTIAGAALALNLTGCAVATAAWPLLPDAADRAAMLFTVSKKEFSIALVVVAASGLPAEVALPAAAYAVVQMLTSPALARLLAGRRAAQITGGSR